MNEIRPPQKGGPARADWGAALAAEVNRHSRLLEAAAPAGEANPRRARRPPERRPFDWRVSSVGAGGPVLAFDNPYVLLGGELRQLPNAAVALTAALSLVSIKATVTAAGDPAAAPPDLSAALEALALPANFAPLRLYDYGGEAVSPYADYARVPLYVFSVSGSSVWCECDLRPGLPALALPVTGVRADLSAASGPVLRLLHSLPGYPPSAGVARSEIPVTRYEE